MSTWRTEGHPCPLDETPLDFDACRACRFFRGASLRPRAKAWVIACNWPRSGSEIAWPEIPAVFVEGMK